MKTQDKLILASVLEYLSNRELTLDAEIRSINKLKAQLEILIPSKKQKEEKELNWEQEIMKVLKKYKKPMTKSMMRAELSKKFSFCHRDAMIQIASVMYRNKNKTIRAVKHGWYVFNT